jgi:hypothetical protein
MKLAAVGNRMAEQADDGREQQDGPYKKEPAAPTGPTERLADDGGDEHHDGQIGEERSPTDVGPKVISLRHRMRGQLSLAPQGSGPGRSSLSP